MAKAFSNSMAEGNYPDIGASRDTTPKGLHDSEVPKGWPDNGDAEGRGGDHREIQDNGTQGKNFSVGAGGSPSVSRVPEPLPRDPHAPPGMGSFSDFYQQDQGLNENVEVGHDSNYQTDYGYGGRGASTGPSSKKNRMD